MTNITLSIDEKVYKKMRRYSEIDDASFYWPLPYDFLGNPIYDSPDAGAYEYQPEFNMANNAPNLSSIIRVYGDEKWKIKTFGNSNTTVNLTITFPGSDTSQWVDINISEWNNTGTRNKTWTESSEISDITNVIHVVGDLDVDTNYLVKVDNIQGQNISGTDCTSGVCASNSTGHIIFNYTGRYSTHTFHIEEQPETSESETSSSTNSNTATGGEGYQIFTLTTLQLEEGYGKAMYEGWSLKFDFKDQAHKLKIEGIQNDSATIIISSNPMIFNLSTNETKKINLNEDNYYDLLLEIKNISRTYHKSLKLFVKSINEEILDEQEALDEQNASSVSSNGSENEKIGRWADFWKNYLFWLAVLVVLIIMGLIFILFKIRRKSK